MPRQSNRAARPKMKGPILIVEDNDPVLDFWAHEFERHNYLVLPYSEGRKAVKDIIGGLRYAIAVIDYSLPDISGGDVIRASKRFHPYTPIICVSGYCGAEFFNPTGVDEVYDKGQPNELIRAVFRRLER